MTAPVYPKLAPVVVMPEGRPNTFEVMGAGQTQGAMLGSGAIVVAQSFDGTQSCAEIAERLIARGVPLPGAEFVRGLAVSLSKTGLVTLHREAQAPAVETHGPLRHRCLGCGRSCEGHRIGPLERAFHDRLPKIRAALDPLYPDIAALASVTDHEEGDARAWLRHKTGTRQCVFLGEDKRCRIHAHLGAEAKPLACRYFPLGTALTEDGHRAGLGGCYKAHLTWQAEPPRSAADITGIAPEEMTLSGARGLDPEHPDEQHLAPWPGTPAHRNLMLERRLMAIVARPGAGIEALWGLVAEVSAGFQTVLSDDDMVEGDDFVEAAATRVREAARLALAEGEDWSHVAAGGHVEAVQRMLTALSQVDGRTLPGWSAEERTFAMWVARDWFYLRHWHLHPLFDISVAHWALGMMAARWCASEPPEAGRIRDGFAEPLVAWGRFFRPPQHLRWLFADPEAFKDLVDALP